MLRSPSRTSQKTGVAPQCSITLAVAGQVIGLVITSSPGPTPSASSARWSAAVPEVTASTCSASRYAAMRSSSSAARGPVVSQPERSVSTTAAISSSPIAGGWKPSLVLRGGRIDQEAYGLRRTASPRHARRRCRPRWPGSRRPGRRRGGAARSASRAAGRPAPTRTPSTASASSIPDRLAEHALGRDEEEDARSTRRHAVPQPPRARAILVTLCHKGSRRARTRGRGR